MLLSATPFSGGQLSLIIIVSVVFAVLLIANAVLLYLFFYKRKKRNLCTAALQQRREKLLEELYNLRANKPIVPEPILAEGEEEEEIVEEFEELKEEVLEDDVEEPDEAEEEEDETDEPEEEIPEVSAEEEEELSYVSEDADDGTDIISAKEGVAVRYSEILAVREMSTLMRETFGFIGSEYSRKQYYVRNSYSFEAKLRAADDTVKARYQVLANEFRSFGRVRAKRSFRQERYSVGRQRVAMLLFKGKTLCVALALDPKEYADTKYRGADLSAKKRFAATPMLIKLTSARRVQYVRYLFAQLAAALGLEAGESHEVRYDLNPKTRGELFAEQNLKITITGEAPDLEIDPFEEEASAADAPQRASILAVCDMTQQMRECFGFVGAEYNAKRYYVRYSFGFESKLRSANDAVKARFADLMNEVGWYKKLTVTDGFRQKSLRFGRKTVGIVLFKGKTLCVAFALDPKAFAETRYRGEDVSEVKRFHKTPMLVRLTSDRRLANAKYLLNRLAEANMMELNAAPVEHEYAFDVMDRAQLFAAGLMKITVIGEVKD